MYPAGSEGYITSGINTPFPMNVTTLLLSITFTLFVQTSSRAAEAIPIQIQLCEAQGLVAYGTAREAIVKGKKRAYWKVQPETSEFQNSFLDDLYKRMDEQGFKDHLLFGAEKLTQCLKSEQVPVPQDSASLSTCFAEMDVVLHARTYKAGGGGIEGTKKYARNYVKDPTTYPQSMLDRIIPLAFSADEPEKLQQLREGLLSACVLPKLPSR
jgi:hypothetical protein